jgi:hypothetical protein
MCDPATLAMMATAAKAASAVSGVVGAIGAVQQGRSQAKIGEYNAKVAENQAIAARQKAEFDEDRQRQQARMFAGRQRASLSQAGGELMDAGDVLGMTAEEAEIDALAIRYGGNIAAQSAQQKGALAKAEAKQASKASYAKAGQTLLTAGGRALENYTLSGANITGSGPNRAAFKGAHNF